MRKFKSFPAIANVLLILILMGVVAACGSSSENKTTPPVKEVGGKASVSPANKETDSKNAGEENKDKSAVKFPTKEIKFIIPVSPGGGMDTIGRFVSKYWAEHLGATIVPENIPGAEYNNAIFAMLKGKPDGHQVIFTPGVIINQLLSQVNYDLKQFEWIGRVSSTYQLTAASKKSGIHSLKELKQKGSTTVAVTGLSSSQTVGQLLAAKELGFKISPVTHKGSTEAILSTIRGDSDWTTTASSSLMGHIKNGDVVPLFVAADKRLPELPDTPTLIELGYPKVDTIMSFHRLVATNPGTPPEIVKRLRDTLKQAVEDPRFIEDMKKLGEDPNYLSGEKTAAFVSDSLDLIKPNLDYLKSFK